MPSMREACASVDGRCLESFWRTSVDRPGRPAKSNAAGSEDALGMRHLLDADRLRLVDRLDLEALDAVMLDLHSEAAAAIRRQIAAREGPIIPVLSPDAQGQYDAARLLIERTVTINTAAAGGDAGLLALSGET